MTTFGDYNAATRMQQLVEQMAINAVNKQITPTRLAVVQSVNRVGLTATVLVAGDTAPVVMRYLPDEGPWGPGDLVEIGGPTGAVRIQRVIYSPSAPGGTIYRPALLNPSLGGAGGNGAWDSTGAVYYETNGGLPGVGNAWAIGQWQASDPALSNITGGFAEINIMQTVGTKLLKRYHLPIFGQDADAASWYKALPYESAGRTDYLADIDLEYQITTDASFTYVAFRTRQTALAGSITTASSINFEMWLHGNWSKVAGSEALVTGQLAASIGYQMTPKGKSYFIPWTYVSGANSAGASTIPPYQNGWLPYDGQIYSGARFMRDKKGKCHMQGLVQQGTSGTTAPQAIFTLPLGLRPAFRLDFFVQSNTGTAQVSILADGTVEVFAYFTGGASGGYVSLEAIEWFPEVIVNSTTGQTNWPWKIIPLANMSASWTNFGGLAGGGGANNLAPMRYYIDEDNMCHWSGSIASGGSGVTSPILNPTNLPAECVPFDYHLLFTQLASGGSSRVDVSTAAEGANNPALFVQAYMGGATNALVSLEGITYVPDYTKSTAVDVTMYPKTQSNLANSWVWYGAPYEPPRYIRDSAGWVRMRGLVHNGNAAGVNIWSMTLPHLHDGFSHIFVNESADAGIFRIELNETGLVCVSSVGGSPSNLFICLDAQWYLPPGEHWQ